MAESLSESVTMSTTSTTQMSLMLIHQPSQSLKRSSATFSLRSQELLDLLLSGKFYTWLEEEVGLTIICRDTEESAPNEFPPEQPEADLVADGEEYGAEELAEEEEELAEEAAAVDPDAMVDDSEMAGAEVDPAAEESDAGSEDLEAESSGSEDELEEEEVEGEAEAEADDAMDMDGAEKPALVHHTDEVMAH